MKAFRRPKFRLYLKKVITIVLPIFSTLFIFITTAIIIALINGYSLDINKRTVIKTGVLNIETNPTEAEISVSGVYYGKSNRAIPNLRVGSYTVTISREGYFPYTKKVEIEHGLASPVIVPMLRTTGQKDIISLKEALSTDYNTTGYYVLTTLPLVSASTTAKTTTLVATASLTPTPTKTKTKEATMTYTLTRIYVTKPLFDDPQPVLDEKMTLTTLSATPITSISASPTGKLLLVTLTDKAGGKSISLVPFKRNTTINVNLTDSKSLTSYNKMKGTVLSWSKNGDYIIIETPEQIISYNVKAGTRVILAEKAELLPSSNSLAWNLTDTGIVVLRKSAGTKTNAFEVSDISYNGNPLTTQLPTLSFDVQPTKIWSFSTLDTPRYVIASKTGTYLIGKLYDAKTSDHEITLASNTVGSAGIEHFNNDYSKIKISEEELLTAPMIWADKQLVAFTEGKSLKLTLFIYNKRIADKQTILGRKELYSGKNVLNTISSIAHATYISAHTDNTLLVSDTTGENIITLQTGISTFTLGQNDTALLFTNEEKMLMFKVLR